jgi:hypothetical protein
MEKVFYRGLPAAFHDARVSTVGKGRAVRPATGVQAQYQDMMHVDCQEVKV